MIPPLLDRENDLSFIPQFPKLAWPEPNRAEQLKNPKLEYPNPKQIRISKTIQPQRSQRGRAATQKNYLDTDKHRFYMR
jgi:hypothetical protein